MQDALYFLPTHSRTILPTRANENDAGLDLYALEDVELKPGEIKRFDVGLKVALSRTQVGLFWDKSGRAWDMKADKPVGLSIIGGCIDGPYRGPLSVVVGNLNVFNTLQHLWLMGSETNKFLVDHSARAALEDTIRIPYGKALTQFIVLDSARFPTAQFTDEETWNREFASTSRGEKGFGSSEEPRGLVGGTLEANATYVVEIISGPYKGTHTAVVPKDVLYYKGVRHVRTGPTELSYRLG